MKIVSTKNGLYELGNRMVMELGVVLSKVNYMKSIMMKNQLLESGKVDGNGWFRISINDELRPIMADRFAILCSEGTLCAG